MMKITGKKICILIVSITVVLNLGWFLMTTYKYAKFVEAVPKNKWGLYFVVKEDGYMYSVKKPDYLTFTGNLAVADNKKMEALFIWPLMSGGYEYGYRRQDNGAAYEIYVDENMEPIHKDDMVEVQKIKEHKAELEALFSKANKMWQLK